MIFQFTPLREGRTLDALKRVDRESISIHAPAGGATLREKVAKFLDTIFQFTPLREGRLQESLNTLIDIIFQFTPLREGDVRFQNPFLRSIFQFTPLREGRLRKRSTKGVLLYFNSRPCGRGDRTARTGLPRRSYFNSRPCGRGDCGGFACSLLCIYFNSRPCGRGDEGGTAMADERTISIHAPAEGRRKNNTIAKNLHIFQFTPLREGRRGISAPRTAHSTLFQFTPLREGRRAGTELQPVPDYFNSRPCGRGDNVS